MSSSAIVQKLWNYCNVLRDDGLSYGDYPSASLRTAFLCGHADRALRSRFPSHLLRFGKRAEKMV